MASTGDTEDLSQSCSGLVEETSHVRRFLLSAVLRGGGKVESGCSSSLIIGRGKALKLREGLFTRQERFYSSRL